jgi:Asp-tRNA(Asn)/Glu-tRNA(Gln) amidotransferase A subunit family amidase
LISAAGIVAQSFSADHIGPMARSVEDLAAIMAVIAGPDPADPTCLNTPPPDFVAIGPAKLDGVRVGIPVELLAISVQPAVHAGFMRALAALKDLGAQVLEVSVPLLARATGINNAIVPPETMAQHQLWQAGWFQGREIRYGDDVSKLLAMGAGVSGTATILAQRDRIELGCQLDQVFADSADVLLTPAQPMTAIPLDDPGMDLDAMIHFLCPFSLTGVPALALPSGADERGLPVSVQIVGPRLHDPRVLTIGRALEAALGPGRRPNL